MEQRHKDEFDNFDVNVIELANYIYSHFYLIVLGALAASSIVGLFNFFLTKPSYKSVATVAVASTETNPFAKGANPFSDNSEMDQKINLITSFGVTKEFLQELLEKISAPESDSFYIGESRPALTIRYAFKNLKLKGDYEKRIWLENHLTFDGDTVRHLILVQTQTHDPDLSAALANFSAKTLVDINMRNNLVQVDSMVQFMRTQAAQTLKKLHDLEDEISAIQLREKVFSIPEMGIEWDRQTQARRQALVDLQVNSQSTELWIKQIEIAIDEFRNNLKTTDNSHLYLVQLQNRLNLIRYQKLIASTDRAIASEPVDKINQDLQRTVDEFNKTYELFKGKIIGGNPWAYLDDLERTMTQAKDRLAEAKARMNAYARRLEQDTRTFKKIPETAKVVARLNRQLASTSELYKQLQSKLQETEIMRIGKKNDFDLVEPAQIPLSPMGLSIPARFLVSFFAGAAFIFVFLALRYVFAPTIRSLADFRNLNVDVLSEIPFLDEYKPDAVNETINTILGTSPTSRGAHMIRQTRFALEEKLKLRDVRGRGPAKVVTISSANAGDGKSFLTAHLAHAFALAQFRVLIIDLETQKRSMRSYYLGANDETKRIEDAQGDFEFRKVPINAFVDLVEPFLHDGVFTDLLETPLLGDYLNEKKNRYDIILIDTPAIRNGLEPMIGSRFSDALVFVTNQRLTLRHDVARTLETVRDNFDGPIFGVLNFAFNELNTSRSQLAS